MLEGTVKLNTICPHCGNPDTGTISKAGPNFKLTCDVCMRYIKFVGKTETFRYTSVEEASLDKNAYNDLLQEINFKLDLLMDRFDIRTKDEK